MFVRAEFMPHKIKITDIRVQRLQDISDEDCLAEGIIKYANGVYTYIENGKKYYHAELDTPQKAYAALIDKISGKGTWKRNPWVFVYTFSLSNSDSNKEVVKRLLNNPYGCVTHESEDTVNLLIK